MKQSWIARLDQPGGHRPPCLPPVDRHELDSPARPPSRWTLALLGAYALVQLAVPLRPWFYPGNPYWTEDGHRFSWHMMMRSKQGSVWFRVVDRTTGESRRVYPQRMLTPWQVKAMRGKPDMMLSFAHYLARRHRERTGHRASVHAHAKLRFNGREPANFVAPQTDLTQYERSLASPEWVLPAPD